ncbi:MAG: DNA-processing protein DprA [Acidimicrobiia bacterium]
MHGPPGRPGNFPIRNVVTSGLSLGTVVVEASVTSGAKSQARRALEHGKHLFLLESLVRQEEWARRYAEHPAATVVADAAQITAVLGPEEAESRVLPGFEGSGAG